MIHVIVTTYIPTHDSPRKDYLHRVLVALRDKLVSPEPLHFVLANDGPPDQEEVFSVGDDVLSWHKRPWTATGGGRLGIGGSLNRALGLVGAGDPWMYTTDDWLLTGTYGIQQAVRLIRELGYDYVRLGPPHPNVTCVTKFQQGLGWWLELVPQAPGYVFGTRPFLAHRRMVDYVGLFKERCDAYVCERDYADRVANKYSHMASDRLAEVVCQQGGLEGPWEHVGDFEVGDRYP